MAEHESRPRLTAVSTVLTPVERIHVDAAGEGMYRTLHRDRVEDVIRDLRERRSEAVIVSVACCDQHAGGYVARMVREFPRVPTIALLGQFERSTPQSMLLLGRSGIRKLVDVRDAAGWRELRSVLIAGRGDGIQRLALAQLAEDLSGVPEDCWRFFETLFLVPPRVCTIRGLARMLAVPPSTFMSRFYRAGLPAPKRYLVMARLVRAARLFENPGFSVANVADHLDYSSPQSFGRHVRTMLGVTAHEFRLRYDGERMLQHFRETMVLPYLPALRRLTPLAAPVAWAGRTRARSRLA